MNSHPAILVIRLSIESFNFAHILKIIMLPSAMKIKNLFTSLANSKADGAEKITVPQIAINHHTRHGHSNAVAKSLSDEGMCPNLMLAVTI